MKKWIAVLLFAATPLFAKNMYIPAAGITSGQNGTFWRTDLRIYNPSPEETIEVSLHFLPQGMDGTNVGGRTFSIPPRGTLVLDNAVATLAPQFAAALGAIRIDSDAGRSYEFAASSRTYTTGAHGSLGQFVPALDPAEAITRSVVLHVASTNQFRTNFGVMNPGLGAVTVRVKLLGIDGSVFLESQPLTIEPRSMEQWSLPSLFGGVFMQNGTAVIEATAPVFTWGSVVDNVSGDPIYVRGVLDQP